MNKFEETMKKLGDLLAPLFAPKDRAITLSDMMRKVYEIVGEMGDGYLENLYIEDGQTFAIIASDGKLYKATVTLNGTDPEVGEWQPVEITFVAKPDDEEETRTRSRTTITRQSDGRFRWFSVSCSSVLNRVGEIDTRALFDSFIAHAEKTNKYPYRTFYHSGEQFRTGQADFLARDENLLITSGVYDDSEIAKAEITARTAEPDKWGDSIGYNPTREPEYLEAGDGIKILAFTEGTLEEISTLPEAHAAAWFTYSPTITEVNRMLDDKKKAAFVALFGGDEEKANAWLEENATARNRAIKDKDMITRDADSQVTDPPADPVTVTDDDPQGQVETETAAAPVPLEQQVFELTEEALTEIVSRAIQSEQITNLLTANADMVSRVAALESKITSFEDTVKKLNGEVRSLQRSDEQKHAEWLADLPATGPGLKVTYRARAEQPDEDDEETEIDGSTQAAAVLEKLPGYNSGRK